MKKKKTQAKKELTTSSKQDVQWAHCSRCRSTFNNMDGCPVCGTDRYLVYLRQ